MSVYGKFKSFLFLNLSSLLRFFLQVFLFNPPCKNLYVEVLIPPFQWHFYLDKGLATFWERKCLKCLSPCLLYFSSFKLASCERLRSNPSQWGKDTIVICVKAKTTSCPGELTLFLLWELHFWSQVKCSLAEILPLEWWSLSLGPITCLSHCFTQPLIG